MGEGGRGEGDGRGRERGARGRGEKKRGMVETPCTVNHLHQDTVLTDTSYEYSLHPSDQVADMRW